MCAEFSFRPSIGCSFWAWKSCFIELSFFGYCYLHMCTLYVMCAQCGMYIHEIIILIIIRKKEVNNKICMGQRALRTLFCAIRKQLQSAGKRKSEKATQQKKKEIYSTHTTDLVIVLRIFYFCILFFIFIYRVYVDVRFRLLCATCFSSSLSVR